MNLGKLGCLWGLKVTGKKNAIPVRMAENVFDETLGVVNADDAWLPELKSQENF